MLGDPVLAGVTLRDPDVAVLALATELADVTGAALTLLHVHRFQPPIASAPSQLGDDAARGVSALAAASGAQPLCRLSASPVRALHEAAEELGCWAIVVGSSQRAAPGRVLPSGVGERLLHAAPCVVAIAPRGYVRRADGLRRIGVASAGQPDSSEAHAQAEAIVEATGGELTTLRIVGGGIADGLAAASAGLDALVIGAPGHGRVSSLRLGSVARTLAHTACCPLFVTPSSRR